MQSIKKHLQHSSVLPAASFPNLFLNRKKSRSIKVWIIYDAENPMLMLHGSLEGIWLDAAGDRWLIGKCYDMIERS